MSHYPTLRIGVLTSLMQLKEDVDRNPDFLKAADCPYDRDVVDTIMSLFKVKTVEKIIYKGAPAGVPTAKRGRPRKEGDLSESNEIQVEDEITDLMVQLKNLSVNEKGEDKALDSATKIQIIKTKSALIEKVLQMRERANNVRRAAHFQETVMGILDDIVTEDGRALLLERLEPFRSY